MDTKSSIYRDVAMWKIQHTPIPRIKWQVANSLDGQASEILFPARKRKTASDNIPAPVKFRNDLFTINLS